MYGDASERRHDASVETFDQTVGRPTTNIFFLAVVMCSSSRLIFESKTDLNRDLEFFDFVVRN